MPSSTTPKATLTPYSAICILLYSDSCNTTVLGLYADLRDANEECLKYARGAGIVLEHENSTFGPDDGHYAPTEPMRWDAPEGLSCWVEQHTVTPKKVVTPEIN